MSLSKSTQQQIKKRHFYYEIRHTAWFGPLNKATTALSMVSIQPLTEEEFLSYLQINFPKIYTELTFVQFYQFKRFREHKLQNGNDYRIAVCYLKPNPIQRDSLYILREQITCATGWYPLVMGERAMVSIKVNKLPRHQESIAAVFSDINIGRLMNIRNIATGEEGSAFLINGAEGSILMDAGMAIHDPLPSNLKAVFLSHFHYDHSGGLKDILGYKKPLFISEPTLRYLHESKYQDENFQNALLANALVIEKLLPVFQSNRYFHVFPVFHAPGSYGFSLSDTEGRWLFYPGDFCLKNGFLDAKPDLLNIVQTSDAKRKWVLIDATMVSREQFEISNEDTPEALIDAMTNDLVKRNVVFCSQSVETLIYQYILTFVRTRPKKDERAAKLFVPHSLFRLAQSLLGPLLYRNFNQIDPFIQSVIGKNVTNFIESHRVYPLESLADVSPNEKVIIFVTPYDIQNQEEVQKRIFRSNVILAGTLALRPEQIPEIISAAKPRTVLRVASPDWSFHSHEDDLAEFIRTLSANGVTCLLFHSWPKKLEKFIRQHDLNRTFVSAVGSTGVSLE